MHFGGGGVSMRGPRGPAGAPGATGATGATGVTGAAAGATQRAVGNGSRTPAGSFVGETCFSSLRQCLMTWDGVCWYAQDAIKDGSRKSIFVTPAAAPWSNIGYPTQTNVSPGGGPGQGTYASTNALTKRARYTYSTTGVAGTLGYMVLQSQNYVVPTARICFVFGVETAIAGMRYMVHFQDRSVAAAPVNQALNLFGGTIGVGADTADTNLQLVNKIGATANANIDLGSAFPAKTAGIVYRATIWAPVSGAWNYEVVRLDTGDIAAGSVSPVGAVSWSEGWPRMFVSNNATAATCAVAVCDVTADQGDL